MAKSYKSWVRNLVAELKEYFFLHDWVITLAWGDESEDPECVANIRTDSGYSQALITVFPLAETLWKEGDINQLVMSFVHEFCHVLTDPIYKAGNEPYTKQTQNFIEEIRERQTQKTAVIILRNLPKKFYKV